MAWTTAAYPFGVPNQIPTRDTGPVVLSDEELDKAPVRERTSPRSPRWVIDHFIGVCLGPWPLIESEGT